MGIVPGPYDAHGWHEFKAGWQGPDWCGVCDCLIDEHVSREEYAQRNVVFHIDWVGDKIAPGTS